MLTIRRKKGKDWKVERKGAHKPLLEPITLLTKRVQTWEAAEVAARSTPNALVVEFLVANKSEVVAVLRTNHLSVAIVRALGPRTIQARLQVTED